MGQLRIAAGLVTKVELATMLGFRQSWSMEHWIKAGVVPKPRHRINGGKNRYYTEEEAKEIVKNMRDKR